MFFTLVLIILIPNDMPIIKPLISHIDKDEALRYAGLSKSKEWQPQLLQYACDELLLAAQPICIYRIAEHSLDKIESYKYQGQGLTKHLCGCSQVVLLAATLGSAVDEKVDSLFAKHEYAAALLLNAAATAMIEQAADYLGELLYRTVLARGGKCLGRRFSPGYSDWRLEAQREFFPLTGGSTIGIELTDTCSLNPKKSITAVIPIFDDQSSKPNNCSHCDNKGCAFRRPQE